MVELKFGVGEEAARLAGVKDGTEDERYRSVYLCVTDPSRNQVYGPVVKPPIQIERRTYAKFMLKDEPGKIIPADNNDNKGERIMQASRKTLQYLADLTPQDEKTELVYDTWVPIDIHIQVKTTGDLWKITNLEVSYKWGHLAPMACAFLVERGRRKSSAPMGRKNG